MKMDRRLQYVVAAARYWPSRRSFKVIVDKSTVPVGTANRVTTAIAEELKARSASLIFRDFKSRIFLKKALRLKGLHGAGSYCDRS